MIPYGTPPYKVATNLLCAFHKMPNIGIKGPNIGIEDPNIGKNDRNIGM